MLIPKGNPKMKSSLLMALVLAAPLSFAKPDIRSDKDFVEACPPQYLTYLDKKEGGPGAYCNCPEANISYIDKSEGGPGAICIDEKDTMAKTSKPKTVKGTAYGFKAQDSGASQVVRSVVQGAPAKMIFEHLTVDPYTLPGKDGEQTTKQANGVICGHFSGKRYFCTVDFAGTGVSQ
jgi:hypothetical protein